MIIEGIVGSSELKSGFPIRCVTCILMWPQNPGQEMLPCGPTLHTPSHQQVVRGCQFALVSSLHQHKTHPVRTLRLAIALDTLQGSRVMPCLFYDLACIGVILDLDSGSTNGFHLPPRISQELWPLPPNRRPHATPTFTPPRHRDTENPGA